LPKVWLQRFGRELADSLLICLDIKLSNSLADIVSERFKLFDLILHSPHYTGIVHKQNRLLIF